MVSLVSVMGLSKTGWSCVPTMPAIVPGARAGARDEPGAVVVPDGVAWYGVEATNGVVLVDETSVVRLVCRVGRGDAIMKDVRDVCELWIDRERSRCLSVYSRWSSLG